MLQATLGILAAAGLVFSIGLWASYTSKSTDKTRGRSPFDYTATSSPKTGATTDTCTPGIPIFQQTATTAHTLAEGGGIGPRSHAGTNGL